MTVDVVASRIARLTSLPSFPRSLVIRTLNVLSASGAVETAHSRKGEAIYRLSETRFAEIEDALAQAEKQEQTFRSSVVELVIREQGGLSSEDAALLEDAFHGFVATTLATFGDHCARSLVEHGAWVGASDYPSLLRELEIAVAALPEPLRRVARAAFLEVLRDPQPPVKDYLYFAGQAFYMAKLLHLDPELQALQRIRFEGTVVFLDTNLLLSALLPEDAYHEGAVALIRLCVDLRFRLAYSEETAEEIARLIQAADQEYARFPPFDFAAASKIALAVENPFLRAWLVSWPDHRSAWTQFRARVGAWPAVLDHLGVTLSLECSSVAIDEAKLVRTQTALVGAGARPSRRRRQVGVGNRERRPRAAEHDAQMLLAVESLAARDESVAHPFGNRYWFITLDRRLADFARESLDRSVGCVCLVAEEWVQYIAPFVAADVSQAGAQDVFTKLLSSRFFLSLSGELTLRDLQPFTAPNIPELLGDLSAEEAARAVTEAHVVSVASDLHQGSDDARVTRLVDLVERKLNEKRRSGELVKADDVDLLKAAHASEAAVRRVEIAAKDNRILSLEHELQRARAYKATSIRFRAERLGVIAARGRAAATSWIRLHPRRAVATATAVAAGSWFVVTGPGGAVGRVTGAALALLSLLSVKPRTLVDNFKDWIGWRPR